MIVPFCSQETRKYKKKVQLVLKTTFIIYCVLEKQI